MSRPPASLPPSLPLVLDLDGTLVLNDLTHELIAGSALRVPWRFPGRVAMALRGDKPGMKREMLREMAGHFDPAHLPYTPAVLDLARAHRAAGGKVYLCSGSHEDLVHAIVAHLPELDGGWGTRDGYNMTSSRKAAFLQAEFPDGFAYVGNSTQDLKVWAVAERALAVDPPPEAGAVRDRLGGEVLTIHRSGSWVRGAVEALRSPLWAALPLPFLGSGIGEAGTGAVIAAVAALLLAAALWTGSVLFAPGDRVGGRAGGVAGGHLSVPAALALGAVALGLATTASAAASLPGALLVFPLALLARRGGATGIVAALGFAALLLVLPVLHS